MHAGVRPGEGVRPPAFGEPRKPPEKSQVGIDNSGHAWPPDLNDHIFTGLQRCRMNLRDRGCGDRSPVKAGKNLLRRSSQILKQNGCDIFVGLRCYVILQSCQGAGPFRSEKIVACRQNLTQLDGDGPKILQQFDQRFRPCRQRFSAGRAINAQSRGYSAPAMLGKHTGDVLEASKFSLRFCILRQFSVPFYRTL